MYDLYQLPVWRYYTPSVFNKYKSCCYRLLTFCGVKDTGPYSMCCVLVATRLYLHKLFLIYQYKSLENIRMWLKSCY